MSSSGAVQSYDVSPYATSLLASGEEVVQRWWGGSSSTTLTSGLLVLTYFTARKTETIGNVATVCRGTAAAVPTLCRMGVYSVAVNGDIALLAACANDTTIWNATFAAFTRALTVPWSKVTGTRYAAAALYVGATVPVLYGPIASAGGQESLAPRLIATLSGQADLPASVASASLAGSANGLYVAFTP